MRVMYLDDLLDGLLELPDDEGHLVVVGIHLAQVVPQGLIKTYLILTQTPQNVHQQHIADSNLLLDPDPIKSSGSNPKKYIR